MTVAVQLEPAASVPAVEYRWDADTEILTARLRGANGRTGMSGSVELEGSDGSWLILDVASGCIDGVEVAVWPDVHKRRGLAPPAAEEARVVGDLMLQVETPWSQAEANTEAENTQAALGWCLDPAYAGRGYATEAAAELLRICFEELGLRRVVAGAFADNLASIRVMEKIGMRIEGRTRRASLHRDLGWLDGVEAAILVEEWRGIRS